jgi:uncharacterized protein Yka (UPF0111/DUF47 family)
MAKLLKEMGDRKQALLYFDRASESYKGLHRQVEEFEQELDSIKRTSLV